jgi:hypothetical protein
MWIWLDIFFGRVWEAVTDGYGNPRWLDRIQAYCWKRAYYARKRRGR